MKASIWCVVALLGVMGITGEVAAAEINSSAAPLIDEVRTIPPVMKWYAGGGLGFADMNRWWNTQPVDDYYRSQGYFHTGGSFLNLMDEGKIYTGYRLRDYMDVELGYSLSNTKNSDTYQNTSGNTVWSRRELTAHVLYASALFRPPEGYGHLLFLKLGGHLSQLRVSKSVTGNPPNLGVIAAGDHMPEDGTSTGFGSFFGVGLDIRTGKEGAIRLELNRLYRVGGTRLGKDAFNVGYQINF